MTAKKYADVMQMFLQRGKTCKNFSSVVNTVSQFLIRFSLLKPWFQCRVIKAEEGKISVEFEVT